MTDNITPRCPAADVLRMRVYGAATMTEKAARLELLKLHVQDCPVCQARMAEDTTRASQAQHPEITK